MDTWINTGCFLFTRMTEEKTSCSPDGSHNNAGYIYRTLYLYTKLTGKLVYRVGIKVHVADKKVKRDIVTLTTSFICIICQTIIIYQHVCYVVNYFDTCLLVKAITRNLYTEGMCQKFIWRGMLPSPSLSLPGFPFISLFPVAPSPFCKVTPHPQSTLPAGQEQSPGKNVFVCIWSQRNASGG